MKMLFAINIKIDFNQKYFNFYRFNFKMYFWNFLIKIFLVYFKENYFES